jgi:hypothetical protein
MFSTNELTKAMAEILEEKLRPLHEEIVNLKESVALKSIKNIDSEVSTLRNEGVCLKKRIDELEKQQLRNNIRLYNIPEAPKLPKEDCDKKAIEILKTVIPEFNNKTLTKAFCLGPFKDGQVRPIVCCFHHFKDKLAVVSNRSKLQQQNIFLSDDFTKEDDDARALLRPSFTAAKRMKFDTKLQGNKVVKHIVPVTSINYQNR